MTYKRRNFINFCFKTLISTCFTIITVLMFQSGYGQVCNLTVNAGGSSVMCSGSIRNLNAVVSGYQNSADVTYSWSPTIGLDDPNIPNPIAAPTQTTTYTVTVTEGLCTAQDKVIITVNPVPAANVGTNQAVCIGSSIQLGSLAVVGDTYSWSANPSDPSLAAGTKISNPTVSPIQTTTYTLKETTSATGCFAENNLLVTVSDTTLADFTFSDNQCSGSPVHFITTVTTPGNYTFKWNFGDGKTSGTQSPYHLFSAPGVTGTATFAVSLNVFNRTTGCSNVIAKQVTVLRAPDASFDLSNTKDGTTYFNGTFTNCTSSNLNPDFTFKAYNASSTISSNTKYEIDWGEGNGFELLTNFNTLSDFVTHDYHKLGFFSIILRAYNSTDCFGERTYVFFNGNAPGGNLQSIGNTSDCAPYTVTWPIVGTEANPPGTKYVFSVNDGSSDTTFTQENLPTQISHTFTKSSCGIGLKDNSFTVSFQIINPCTTNITTTLTKTTVKPTASFDANTDSVICQNTEITFTDSSIGNYFVGSQCSQSYTKTWSITPATGWLLTAGQMGPTPTGTSAIKVRFLNSGQYKVELMIHQPGTNTSRCTSDFTLKTICVEAPLTPSFSFDQNIGCAPLTVRVSNTTDLTKSCANPTYTWAVAYSPGSCGKSSGYQYANGTSSTSANPTFLFSNPGNYDITLTTRNSCGIITSTKQTIIVNKPPIVTLGTIASICQTYPETSISPTATATDCTVSPFTYAWTFPNAIPATSNLPIPGQVKYSSPGTYSVNLTVTNSCGSTTAVPVNFTIQSTPLAAISGTTVVCEKSNPLPIITLSATGGTGPYTFTYNINGGTSQFITTQNGSKNVTIAVPTSIPGTFTYNLTAIKDAFGLSCNQSQSGSATVTVVPNPSASITASGNGCSNETSPTITFQGSNGTAPYTFIYNINGGGDQSITTISGSSITIPVPTNVVGKFDYKLTGVKDANPGSCLQKITGIATTNIYPIPIVNNFPDLVHCNLDVTDLIPLTATYTWTNSDPSIGINAQGIGDIPSFIIKNASQTPIYSTVTITPFANGCSGTSKSFQYTINPSPNLTFSIGDQAICSGSNSSAVTLNTTTSNANIDWTTTQPTGISGITVTQGTTSIPVQNLTNSGSNPITITYLAQAYITGGTHCSTALLPYNVTVNPIPNVATSQQTTICSGTAFSVIPKDGSGNLVPANTRYTWSDPVISPSGAISGGGADISGQLAINQTLINTTFLPATATYTVTPIYTNCTGDPFMVTVTVNPTPTVNGNKDLTLCTNDKSPDIKFSGDVAATRFVWSSSLTNIGVNGSGEGDIASFTALNSTSSPLSALITVTPVANSCEGTSSTFSIKVNPTPVVDKVDDITWCSNQSTQVITFTSPVAGTTYEWTNDNSSIGLAGSGSGNIPSFTTSNITNTPSTASITVIPKANGCTGIPLTFRITIQPVPHVTNPSLSELICSGTKNSAVNLMVDAAGSNFNWVVTSPAGLIGYTPTGSGTVIPSTTIINTLNIQGTINYQVTPVYGTCSGPATTYSVNVNPLPTVTNVLEQTVCSETATASVTLTSNVAGTQFDWNVTPDPSPNVTGYLTSGKDVINSQTITNNGIHQEQIVYHIIPLSNLGMACYGPPSDYILTINPLPSALANPVSEVICSGLSTAITLSASISSVFQWSVGSSDLNISGAASGSGSSIAQQLFNDSHSQPGKVIFKVTPNNGLCAGKPIFPEVTVNPRPLPGLTGETEVCLGTTDVVYTTDSGMTNYNWTPSTGGIITNGVGTNQISLTWIDAGKHTLTANYTNTFGCSAINATNADIAVVPNVPVALSITANANNVCPGTQISFSATAVNGGDTPIYKWLVNGNVVGGNSPNYSYAPSDGDKVACEIISSLKCTTGNTVRSNTITMVIYSSQPSSVLIETKTNNVCPGDSVTFTAIPFNEGFSPTYMWYVNGNKSGPNTPVFNFAPVNNDIITCQLISSNVCTANQHSVSNEIKMIVDLPAIVPNFEIINKNIYKECAPLNVVFRNISPTNGVTYIWTFGDGQSDSSAYKELVPHTYQNFTNDVIRYKIGLKIITSGTHCYIIKKDSITVDPEIIAAAPASYSGCSPLVQKFENAFPGAKSYQWLASDKKTVVSTELTPTLTFQSFNQKDSTYIVYLVATSAKGCMDTIVNTIKVSPPLVNPSFTYSGKGDCKTATLTFQNTSPEGPVYFIWNFGDGTLYRTSHANEVVTHTFHNYMDIPIVFDVTLTSFSGTFCSLSAVKQIKIYPEFVAGFPVTVEGCSPVARQFENAIPGAKSYQWKSQDGKLLSSSASPLLTFQTTSGKDSTFKVLLIAESMDGCIDTIVNNVTVRASVKTTFTATPTEGCAPLNVAFNTPNNSQIIGYNWNFGDNSDFSVLQNPHHTFASATGAEVTYKVTLYANNKYGCGDSVTSAIHLYPTPQIDFTATPAEQVFPSRTIQLSNLTPVGNVEFTWDFNDGKPLQHGQVSSYMYDSPGDYIISLKAKNPAWPQCEKVKYNSISIIPGLPVARFEPDTIGCAPLKIKFRNLSINGSKYLWDLGNNSQTTEFEPTVTYFSEGTYAVTLQVSNLIGEKAVSQRKVVIYPVPKAYFKPEPYRIKIPAQDVTFFNYSENANAYLWNFGDGSTSTDLSPRHQYTQTGTFNISLLITSSEGCKDSLYLKNAVEVIGDGLNIPNAFMPSKQGSSNGNFEYGDPRNTVFYPVIATGDLTDYELLIYNRWGNLIFMSKEVTKGWDGYLNGKLCPQDVYVWKISCKYKNGEVITRTGDVTLIQ